jgi:hypothetical protein
MRSGKLRKRFLIQLLGSPLSDNVYDKIFFLYFSPDNRKSFQDTLIKLLLPGKINMAKEVTLDMAHSMRKIVRSCFPKSKRVIDRFHVQKKEPRTYTFDYVLNVTV